MLVALLVIALAVGAAVVVGSQPRPLPAPFGPAANGQLVYPDGDICRARHSTAAPRTIIGGPTSDSGPLSRRTARGSTFLRGRSASDGADLWVADADGSNARRLAGPFRTIGWAEWSPQAT